MVGSDQGIFQNGILDTSGWVGDPALKCVLHGHIWGSEIFRSKRAENWSKFLGFWSRVQALFFEET